MSEHFTHNTISAMFWCGKCQRSTSHRIDAGRKGPCLSCIDRYDASKIQAPAAAESIEQFSLFPVEKKIDRRLSFPFGANG